MSHREPELKHYPLEIQKRHNCRNYNKCMQIEFDTDKREKTLMERGLDFARAAEVFAGVTVTIEDARQEYDEARFITVGLLDCRTVSFWSGRRAARLAALSA